MTKYSFILILVFTLGVNEANSQIRFDYLLHKGQNELNSSNYKQALNTFNILVRQFENRFETFYFRGVTKNKLTDLVGAEADFNKAILINPFNWRIYYYRGINRSQNYNFFGAISDYDKAISIQSDLPEIYLNRGLAQYSLSLNYKALEDFNLAKKLKPLSPSAYYYKGVVFSTLKQFDEAIINFNLALERSIVKDDVYWRRALAFAEKRDFISALNSFNDAIKLDSAKAKYFFSRANVFLNLKDTTAALNDYNKILAIQPQNALTYFNRAILKQQTSDFIGADLDYSMVLELQTQHLMSYFNRGNVRTKLKKYRQAIDDYTIAIKLHPEFSGAYNNRSIAKRKIGMKKSALLDFNQAKLLSKYEKNAQQLNPDFEKLVELPFDYNFNKSFIDNNKLTQNNLAQGLLPNFSFTLSEKEKASNAYFFSEVQSFIHNNKLEIQKEIPNLALEISNFTEITISTDSLTNLEKLISSKSQNKNELKFTESLLKASQKNYNSAIADLNFLILIEKDNPYYYFQRANIKKEMIDFIASVKNKNLTIEKTYKRNSFAKEKSSNKIDYSEVISDYNKAIELKPNFAYAYFNRANTQVNSGNIQKAIIDYKQTISLHKDFSEAYFNLALIYMMNNNKQQACQHLSKAGEKGIEVAYELIKDYCN